MVRKPDYSVGALCKTRDVRQPKIGAAWINKDGSISVRLDPFVVLQGGPERVITLFPNKHAANEPDEEIPF